MPVVEREAPRHHWRRYVSAWMLIVGCGTPTACSDANTGGADEQTLPTHVETTTTAPNATPRASPSPATSSVPTPRYRGMIEEAIGTRQFWMPIMEAELGLHGALWALVASAPREAPGPRLTLLKFTPIGPRGSLALSGPPEHLMVLSQPAVDRQDAGRELARILSAPKTRTRVLGDTTGLTGTPEEAWTQLSADARRLRDSGPRRDPMVTLTALARVVSATTRDVMSSPRQLRALFAALLDNDEPEIVSASARRAELTVGSTRLTLLRRARWSVSEITTTEPSTEPEARPTSSPRPTQPPR